jgi:peroxiredoxin
MKNKLFLISILILGFFILSVILPLHAHASLQVGSKVTPASLRDYRGHTHNLGNSLGKKVTIIWITDLCQVCARGFDNIQELKNIYAGRPVDIYMISTANPGSTAEIAQKYQLTVPVLMGVNEPFTKQLIGSSNMGSCSINNFFIFGRDGKLRTRVHVPGLSTRQLQQQVESALQ